MRHQVLRASINNIVRQLRKRPRRPHGHIVLTRPSQALMVQIVQSMLQRHRKYLHYPVDATGARFVELVTEMRSQGKRGHLLQALQRQHIGQGSQLEETDAVRRMRGTRIYVTQCKVNAAE